MTDFDQLCVNTIRTLAIDMIQKANSGHPGLPLGAAPMAMVLWKNHLKFNPKDPGWIDRDRFILSAGHGSALLYSLMHLAGYDITLDDIKDFRQWGSKTPGHPESFQTPGVEATTGPLGQGTANAVGMAVAERFLANRYNRPGYEIINHYTYALVSDGDIMEGISAEAASIAGHLKLGKLIYLYDSNDISLDGPLTMSFSEDILKRYESYGWQVIRVENGDTDFKAINDAIESAKADTTRPTLIEVKTTIGYGSPNKSGCSSSHGAPLGEDEITLTKKQLGWDWPDKKFHVPEEVYDGFSKDSGDQNTWRKSFDNYLEEHHDAGLEMMVAMEGDLPENWDAGMPSFNAGDKLATRAAAGKTLNALSENIPWLFGTDADLSCSTKGCINDGGTFNGQTGSGRNIHCGVREHAMAAIANGICWHGGLRPFTSTFFVFSDYMRPSVRLAAMNNLPVIYHWTHDSVHVGEDGPTHQPVEQVMSLRLIPDLMVVRPSDATEAVEAWKWAVEQKDHPVALVLTRQGVPVIDREKYSSAENLKKGAYILADADGDLSVIIIATGSEVQLALDARESLQSEGIGTRVVSMPCWEAFLEQPGEYRDNVLPPSVKARVTVEAGATTGWQRWSGDEGICIGIDRFGSSAPGPVVAEKYGMTVENVIEAANMVIEKSKSVGV